MDFHYNDKAHKGYIFECEMCKIESDKIRQLFEELGIPLHFAGPSDELFVNAAILLEILTDETKLKYLISKLRLRAFW